MARRPNSSKQTDALLIALLSERGRWRHGYDLGRETGLKSGTLYPILMRLDAQGWLESRWEDEPAPGKPRRHLYRLSPAGADEAMTLLEQRRPEAAVSLLAADEGGVA